MNKKGISPLIATVIIVGFTVVLAVVVASWAKNLSGDLTSQVSCETEANSFCRNLPPIPVSIFNNSNNIRVTPVNTYTKNLTFLFVVRDRNEQILVTNSVQVENKTSPVLDNLLSIPPPGSYASGNKISYTIFLPYELEGTKCEVKCKDQTITIK